MKLQLRHYVAVLCLYLNVTLSAQNSNRIYIDSSYRTIKSTKVLSEENIDFFSNGFIRSTTNIFEFNVGHPDKFNVPFYLLLGTTADVVSQDRFINEEMTFDMLNANGGLINAGYKLSLPLTSPSEYGQLVFMHQLSMKSISGVIFESGEKKTFVSYMGNLGMMLKVKAWNPEDENNNGQFWIYGATSLSANPIEELKALLSEDINPYFIAVHIESGITLSDGINIKGGYYRFVNNQNVVGFSVGQFKLTGVYNL